ncbi:hypothetical protein ACIGJO_35715 [Streptomyces sp. NPDC079020]|uniref:hypothetical protein n=1 Tax=Streptomyces sp. NPDC079020 TaxID=3365722 RepID=UPI0037D20BCA
MERDMREKGSILTFCSALVTTSVMVISLSGCAFLDNEATVKYPDGKVVSSEILVGKWVSGEAELNLQQGGKFLAAAVIGRYFDCVDGGLNGVQRKTGGGDWRSRESLGASTVFLDFGDGCYTALTVGDVGNNMVLWNHVEGRDGRPTVFTRE